MVSRNSFDSICTSLFLGLTVTAIYNNYYYILTAMISILSIVSAAIRGGIGNHVVTQDREKNYDELKQLDFIYMLVSGWFCICYICLIQPFMEIWMGKNMILPMPVVILFGIYFYLLKTGDMRSIYTEANGLWWEHRYRSISEAIGNLFLNIVLGKCFGIYGIITATIITIFFCNFLWSAHITFRCYFGMDKIKSYYCYHLKYAATSVVTFILTYYICFLLPFHHNIYILLARGIICIFVPGIVLWLHYYHNPLANKLIPTILMRNKIHRKTDRKNLQKKA